MESKTLRKILQGRLLMAVLCVAVGVLALSLNEWFVEPRYSELKANISATSTIVKNISAVERQKNNYEMILDESGKTYNNLMENKDQYIALLGEITMANKLKINKMTVDDIHQVGDGQLYSMKIQIELQGELYNVKNLIQQLYDSETVSRINSFSYRLQNDYNLMWMWRTMDDETLVPWWDMTDSPIKDITGNTEEAEPISADDLLAHGSALCYLEIEFLGLGG